MESPKKQIQKDILEYLDKHEKKDILRFITCGSVDDGKSTLIGRMLYESHQVLGDQMEALKADSKRSGTLGGELDFSLLVDGLQAEREQGITIDVAYRFFSTDKRKYIVADTPGHEEYTRNMATGASTAEVAVILVDATSGISTQTKRHSFIVSMAGVKKVLLAVNKLDLVNYSQEIFNRIVADFKEFCDDALSLSEVHGVPISALKGVNVVHHSEMTPWYTEKTVMDYLESVEVSEEEVKRPFRMPIQWVNRPDQSFRGFAGMVSSGKIEVGERVKLLPSGIETNIKRIVTFDGDRQIAETGRSITVTLTDEVDLSRGGVLCSARSPCTIGDQFQARVLWMDQASLIPGRQYIYKSNTQTIPMTLTKLKHRVDVNSLERHPANVLEINEIGVCTISLSSKIAFDSFNEDPSTGGFIIIDKMTNNTSGMGFIDFPLRRSDNIHWQKLDVTRDSRSQQKGQRPRVVWFTGLSGSGKSSIANVLEKKLQAIGRHTVLLDGDNVRHGLNRDLGFTKVDRVENIRRIAEVSKLMLDAGLICITSFISPFESERRMARSLHGEGEFIEVYVDTPISVCEERDVKGLYAKARSGKLPNFTGISSTYEIPLDPEIRIDTTSMSVEEATDTILEYIESAT